MPARGTQGGVRREGCSILPVPGLLVSLSYSFVAALNIAVNLSVEGPAVSFLADIRRNWKVRKS